MTWLERWWFTVRVPSKRLAPVGVRVHFDARGYNWDKVREDLARIYGLL